MSLPRVVLLHSPLVGPFSLRDAAEALRALGADAHAPAWPRLSAIEGAYYPTLVSAMAATIDGAADGPVILAAHSGAGAFVPALAAALKASVAGAVFIDAILPHPGRSWLDTAPEALRDGLRAGAQMGMLPPWDGWWPPGALEKLVPDAGLRLALVAELEPLLLAYFEEPAPPQDLAGLAAPCAYLQLSDAYADEIRACGRMGWPTVSLPLQHMGPLTHPKAVAQVVHSLAGRLVGSADG
jgi:hypothetical protein